MPRGTVAEWAGDRLAGTAIAGSLPRSSAETGIERYIIYLAVFLAPFLNLKTDLVYFTVSDALFCLALAFLLLRGRLPRAPLGVATPFWIAAFALTVGGLLFSSVFIGDSVRGLVLLLQYSFCFLVLPYILASDDEGEAYRRIVVLLGGVVVLDVHGITTFYTVGYVPGSMTVTGGKRLATLVGDANAAACLNAMTIVVTLWLRSVKRLPVVAFIGFSSIMALALVLTSSNTGLIATSGGVLVFLALTFRLGLLFKILPLACFAAVFLQFGGTDYLPATFQKRVLPAVVSGELSEAGTFADRKDLMTEALDLIGDRGFTLLGIGADQFRLLSVQEAPVHNAFLLLWAEGGIFSLAGWVLFSSLGVILWLLAWRNGIAPNGRAAVFACFLVFVAMASANAHIYQRYRYTVLLLAMQPLLLAFAQSRRPPLQANRS
jgi:O-antigen ligase